MHTKRGVPQSEWKTCMTSSRRRTSPYCARFCFTSRLERRQHEIALIPCERRCQVASSNAQSGDSQPEKGKQFNDLNRAMGAVRAALESAEASLQDVESLPSSRMPKEATLALKLARVAAASLAAVAAVVTSHLFGWPFRIIVGLLAGSALGLHGFRKGSLSRSGGIAAALVGGVTLSSSARAALVLLALYFTSSKLTTYCEDRKLDDESFKKGGQRDWKQVFCNGFVPTVLALAAARIAGGADLPLLSPGPGLQAYTPLTAAFLGYFCCCCGDTWASEVGQVSQDQPRLIISLRPVRKGTNGGVTWLGLLASAAGGMCMGLVFYVAGILSPAIASDPSLRRAAIQQFLVVPFGLAAGLAGSLVDSVLGATVQFTGYNRVTGKITSKINKDVTRISGLPILDNNAVNLVSASVLAAASATISMLARSAGVVGV